MSDVGIYLNIIVEGESDKCVVEALLRETSVPHQVYVSGNKHRLLTRLDDVVKSPGFYQDCRRVVAMRDIDADDRSPVHVRNAFAKHISQLENNQHRFRKWKKTKGNSCELVTLEVAKSKLGSLEDHLLPALKNAGPAAQCARRMITDCDEHVPKARWSRAKAILQIVLAMQSDQPTNMHVALQKQLFDLSASSLKRIRDRIVGH